MQINLKIAQNDMYTQVFSLTRAIHSIQLNLGRVTHEIDAAKLAYRGRNVGLHGTRESNEFILQIIESEL